MPSASSQSGRFWSQLVSSKQVPPSANSRLCRSTRCAPAGYPRWRSLAALVSLTAPSEWSSALARGLALSLITLVHCKYSTTATPGGRLADLYEVCGQDARRSLARRHCSSTLTDAYRRTTAERAAPPSKLVIAPPYSASGSKRHSSFPALPRSSYKPGLSIASSTDEQLRLISGAASYVQL